MAKYDSCSPAHCSQKGTPQISTTARRRQGRSVLLPTWHCPSFFVASIFSKSSTTTVRVLGVGNAGAARTTTVNDAVGTVSLRHPFPARPGHLLFLLQIIAHYCYQHCFLQPWAGNILTTKKAGAPCMTPAHAWMV